MISREQRRQRAAAGGRSIRANPVRTAVVRAAAGAALIAFAAGAGASAAQAQTAGSDSGGVWNHLMQSVGLRPKAVEAGAGISYTERSPLVVPPTRDLPPPGTAAAVPTPDWPKNPTKQGSRPKAQPGLVPGTAMQNPNPPVQKKPWYNPAGWFDKEEYAKFAGEPVRESLTDPPAGYRIPSPEQPYGLSPEKNKGKTQATAADFNYGAATPPTH